MTDKEKEEQKRGLLDFRDKLVFTFVMVNFMWVIAITLMQNEKQECYSVYKFVFEYLTCLNSFHETYFIKIRL